MKIIVLSILLILLISNIHLSKLENTIESIKVPGSYKDENDNNPIKFDLISNESDGGNTFNVSYEVSYDSFVFKRFEICNIIELSNSGNGTSEITCIGKTKFSQTGDIKNISNFDDYTYSTNGFNHTGETFLTTGDYYRLNVIDLFYGVDPEPISSNLSLTSPVNKLRSEHIGEDKLSVNYTIDSTFFSMNRTENFALAFDDETNTNKLTCHGEIKLTVKNTEYYHTLQKEFFILDEEYSFLYVSETDVINNNNNDNINS